jgi:hypothetical protein
VKHDEHEIVSEDTRELYSTDCGTSSACHFRASALDMSL